MNKVGLIQKDDDYYIPEIYACYETSQGPGSRAWTDAFHNVKDTRSPPPIRFIGVWDTVGALGAPGFLGQLFNSKKYQYHDVSLNPAIQNAYHALAIDERRKPFAPNLWKRFAGWQGNLEQSWFPGVHTNVGGSATRDGLANEALHWIVEKAEALGLELNNAFLEHYKPCFNSVLRDSMTPMYKLMGSHVRPIGLQLSDGETVHQSAIDRMNLPICGYSPANLTAHLRSGASARTSNTMRVPRGTACEDQA
jgi:hypothetical protein